MRLISLLQFVLQKKLLSARVDAPNLCELLQVVVRWPGRELTPGTLQIDAANVNPLIGMKQSKITGINQGHVIILIDVIVSPQNLGSRTIRAGRDHRRESYGASSQVIAAASATGALGDKLRPMRLDAKRAHASRAC